MISRLIEQTVAANLKRLRSKSGWTQRQTAKAVSQWLDGKPWTATTVSNYEGIRPRSFTASELVAVSLAFDVRIAELFRPVVGTGNIETQQMLEGVSSGSRITDADLIHALRDLSVSASKAYQVAKYRERCSSAGESAR